MVGAKKFPLIPLKCKKPELALRLLFAEFGLDQYFGSLPSSIFTLLWTKYSFVSAFIILGS